MPSDYEDRVPLRIARTRRRVEAVGFSLSPAIMQGTSGKRVNNWHPGVKKKEKKIHRMCQAHLNSLYCLETIPAPAALETTWRVAAGLGPRRKEG